METAQESIAEKASWLASKAIYKTRDNEETFILWEGEAKDTLHSAIYALHEDGHYWPNDWVYRDVLTALQIIAESEGDSDKYFEQADSVVDIYNHDLKAWFAGHPMATEYVDDVLSDYTPNDIMKVIQIAQMNRYLDCIQMVADRL